MLPCSAKNDVCWDGNPVSHELSGLHPPVLHGCIEFLCPWARTTVCEQNRTRFSSQQIPAFAQTIVHGGNQVIRIAGLPSLA
jgi:hypothetical protein